MVQWSAMRSNSSDCLQPGLTLCFSKASSYLFVAYFLLSLPLLPLYTCVFVQFYQRWRSRGSTLTLVTPSHTDVVTYHMTVLEVLGLQGSVLYGTGTLMADWDLVAWGALVLYVSSDGQTLLHLLTCVERYMAIVHPVTYVSLRQGGGVRLRNAFIGCVWLLCLVFVPLMFLSWTSYIVANFLLLTFTLGVVVSCSVLVVRVLLHPRPGNVGGNKESLDQPKRRALCAILLILGALAVRFFSSMMLTVRWFSLYPVELVLLMWITMLLSLPSKLVLPLLFLQRAEKASKQAKQLPQA